MINFKHQETKKKHQSRDKFSSPLKVCNKSTKHQITDAPSISTNYTKSPHTHQTSPLQATLNNIIQVEKGKKTLNQIHYIYKTQMSTSPVDSNVNIVHTSSPRRIITDSYQKKIKINQARQTNQINLPPVSAEKTLKVSSASSR